MCIRDRDWYARFDELKGMEKSLSKFKTPEALAKSYAELELSLIHIY